MNHTVTLPMPGNRNNNNAGMNNTGTNGNYWSASVNGTNARNMNINSSSVNPDNSNNRANGLTVRCIKINKKDKQMKKKSKSNIIALTVLCLLSHAAAAEFSPQILAKTARSMYSQDYGALDQAKQKKVKQRIEKKHAVLQLAHRSDIPNTKAYKDTVNEASEGILMQMYLKKKREHIVISPQEIKTYYDKHLRDYTSVHAYTLVHPDQNKTAEYIRVLEEMPPEKYKTKFIELAKKYSIHPRRSKGGDMGFVGYNSIVQPFGKEAFKLKENDFTRHTVKTVLGYHIIYVEKRKVLPLDKVRKSIEKILRNQKYRVWFRGI